MRQLQTELADFRRESQQTSVRVATLERMLSEQAEVLQSLATNFSLFSQAMAPLLTSLTTSMKSATAASAHRPSQQPPASGLGIMPTTVYHPRPGLSSPQQAPAPPLRPVNRSFRATSTGSVEDMASVANRQTSAGTAGPGRGGRGVPGARTAPPTRPARTPSPAGSRWNFDHDDQAAPARAPKTPPTVRPRVLRSALRPEVGYRGPNGHDYELPSFLDEEDVPPRYGQ